MDKNQIVEVLNSIENYVGGLANYHFNISNTWKQISSSQINFKHNLCKVYKEKDFQIYWQQYRDFAQDCLLDCTAVFGNGSVFFNVDHRIKEWDSLTDKISRYLARTEQGQIPLKKCLNDIVGFRIRLTCTINMSMLLDELKKVYSDSRRFTCIDASKNGYKAIHLFKRIELFS